MTFSTSFSSSFLSGPFFKYLALKKSFHTDFEQTHFELKKTEKYKLIVYSPECLSDMVRKVLAESGAGVIGNYTHCSFTTKVTCCNLFVHHSISTDLDRIETVVKKNQLPAMIKSINQNNKLKYEIIPLYTLKPSLSIKNSEAKKFRPLQKFLHSLKNKFKITQDETFKLVVYAPETSANKIKNFIELNDMLYSSFSNKGVGRWCKTKSNGEKGHVDSAREERIEMTVKKTNIPYVISILRRFHEYEEMGYDIIKPKPLFPYAGLNMSGLKKKMTFLFNSVLPRIIKPVYLISKLEKTNPRSKSCNIEKSSNVLLIVYTPKSKAPSIRKIIMPKFAKSIFSINGTGNSHDQAMKKTAFHADLKNPCDKEKIEMVIHEKQYPELINTIKLHSDDIECDVLRLYEVNNASTNFIENTYFSDPAHK